MFLFGPKEWVEDRNNNVGIILGHWPISKAVGGSLCKQVWVPPEGFQKEPQSSLCGVT